MHQLHILLALFVAIAFAKNDVNVPTLHQIVSYNFTRPYSCGGNYTLSALFMTSLSVAR